MASALDTSLEAVRQAHTDEVRHLRWEVERLQREVDDLEGELYDLKHPDPKEREAARLWEEGQEHFASVIRHLLHHTGVYDLADLKAAAINAGLDI